MRNSIKTTIAAICAALILSCAMTSCGMSNNTSGTGGTEAPSKQTPSEAVSEAVSDVVDKVIPDPENGKTTKKNSDEYTADEKGTGRSTTFGSGMNGK